MGRGRVDFDRGLARLASYARYYGHANPSANEIWLEWRIRLWVSQLRMKFRSNRLTNDQIAAAEAIGVRFTRPYRDPKPRRPTREEYKEREYLRQLERLDDFYLENGHINVPQLKGIASWPGAGRWIASLRSRYRRGQLPQSVIERAQSMNVTWNPGPGTRQQYLHVLYREEAGSDLSHADLAVLAESYPQLMTVPNGKSPTTSTSHYPYQQSL